MSGAEYRWRWGIVSISARASAAHERDGSFDTTRPAAGLCVGVVCLCTEVHTLSDTPPLLGQPSDGRNVSSPELPLVEIRSDLRSAEQQNLVGHVRGTLIPLPPTLGVGTFVER